jgi:hypothetical protein
VAKLKVDAGNDHEHVPVGTEDLLHHNTSTYNAKEHNLQSLENRIKKCMFLIEIKKNHRTKEVDEIDMYKNRVRLTEFFKDFDRHNCGLISATQVISFKSKVFFWQ